MYVGVLLPRTSWACLPEAGFPEGYWLLPFSAALRTGSNQTPSLLSLHTKTPGSSHLESLVLSTLAEQICIARSADRLFVDLEVEKASRQGGFGLFSLRSTKRFTYIILFILRRIL